jgi:hypothetical protein
MISWLSLLGVVLLALVYAAVELYPRFLGRSGNEKVCLKFQITRQELHIAIFIVFLRPPDRSWLCYNLHVLGTFLTMTHELSGLEASSLPG